MVRLPLTPLDLRRGLRLGRVLRSARGDRSMLDVALAAGLSPETLRKIETGRIATPAFSTVAALAGVLGLSLDAVWTEVSAVGDDEIGAGAPGSDPRHDPASGIVMNSEPRGLPVA